MHSHANSSDTVFDERFLRHEAAVVGSGLIPQAFEVSFGLPVTAGEADPASVPDAVAIALGCGTLRLRGRIDRIDLLPGGRRNAGRNPLRLLSRRAVEL